MPVHNIDKTITENESFARTLFCAGHINNQNIIKTNAFKPNSGSNDVSINRLIILNEVSQKRKYIKDLQYSVIEIFSLLYLNF